MPTSTPATGDTRVRRKVLAATMALAAITYLDRVAIGVTRPYIARDLGPDAHADGLCVQRVLSVVRAVRDSHRLVGRQGRHPQSPDAHRLLVVGVYGADRLCVQLFVAAGDPLSVRRGRGRRVAQRGAHVLALVPAPRSRNGAGHVFHGRAPRWRAHAAHRYRDARVHELADVVRRVRLDRVRLGVLLVPMVSRHARPTPRRQRSRARVHRRRQRSRTSVRSRKRSGRNCWPTAR